MNRQIRIIGLISLLVFLAVFGNLVWVQVVNAEHLANNPDNIRVKLRAYANERGPIFTSDGQTVAESVHTPGEQYKWLRKYPQGQLFADVSGYFSLVYGENELESAYNTKLSPQLSHDLSMANLNDTLYGNSVVGDTITLNIDSRLQQVAQTALGNHKGAVVALDPTTGAILALVTSPSYDPTGLSSHDTNAIVGDWQGLQADPAQPMLNRATNATYPPGSTFKVITAAAALENGFSENQSYPAVNQFLPTETTSPIKNFGGETCGGAMLQAFTVSCNAYFAQLGDALPQGALAKTAQDFGFQSSPPLEIPVAPSRLPSDNDLKSPAYTAQSSIGQYNVAATPLQMALVAAAIANKGVIMVPQLVKSISDPRGNTTMQQPAVWKTAVDPKTASSLTTMMESVVNSPDGTGTAARIPNVMVAGKTGTAQNTAGAAPHAWFIAFAPADAPRIAVAVIVENGGDLGSEATGGQVSAPIAQKVMLEDQKIRGW